MSSQWGETGSPVSLAYSNALRISSPFITGIPSSENATAPASANSVISTSRLPAMPLLTQATCRTRTAAVASAVRCTYSNPATESIGGVVLAIAQMVVKPPAAAARVPVAIVSLCSWPGSRRWQCTSTKPGATINPAASITRSRSVESKRVA